MKKNKNVCRKKKALVYVKFDEFNYEEMAQKERILKKYCDEKSYEIIKTVYDDEPHSWEFITYTMRKILNETFSCRYDKLVACDVDDLACRDKQLLTINQMVNDGEAEIETINQGILGDDMFLDACCFYNIHNKEELKHPRVYYDDNGNVAVRDKQAKGKALLF